MQKQLKTNATEPTPNKSLKIVEETLGALKTSGHKPNEMKLAKEKFTKENEKSTVTKSLINLA